MSQIKEILLFLFCLGLGLKFSGGSLPIVSPLMIVSIAVGIHFLIKIKDHKKSAEYSTSIRFLFLFIIYTIVSLLFTNSPSYGFYKIALLVFWIVAFIILADSIIENFRSFLLYSVITLGVVLILFYRYFGSPVHLINNLSMFFRLGDDESNPITFSRFLGYGILVGVVIFKEKNFSRFRIIAIPFLIIVALIYMFLSGSKGPLFSLVLCFVFYNIANAKFNFKVLLFVGLVGLIITFAMLYFNTLSSSFQDFIYNRFLNSDTSYTSREDRLFFALKGLDLHDIGGMWNLIIGHGSGNFSFIYNGKDMVSYPHNIFVEILYEYGLIGIVLFIIAVVISPIRLYFQNRKYPNLTSKCLVVFWLYFWLNSMVSGDISVNFLVFGFSILCSLQLKRSTQNLSAL